MTKSLNYAVNAFKLADTASNHFTPMYEGTIIDPNFREKLGKALEESIQHIFFPPEVSQTFFTKTSDEKIEFPHARPIRELDPLYTYIFGQALQLPFDDFVRNTNEPSSQFTMFFKGINALSNSCREMLSRFEVSNRLTKMPNHRERPFNVEKNGHQPKIIDPVDYYPTAMSHLQAVLDFLNYVIDVVGEVLPEGELNVFSCMEMFFWVRNLGRADFASIKRDSEIAMDDLRKFFEEHKEPQTFFRLQEMYDEFTGEEFRDISYLLDTEVNRSFHRRYVTFIRETFDDYLNGRRSEDTNMPTIQETPVREVAWAPAPSSAEEIITPVEELQEAPVLNEAADEMATVDTVNTMIDNFVTTHGLLTQMLESLSPRTRAQFLERVNTYAIQATDLMPYLGHTTYRMGRTMAVEEFLDSRFREIITSVENIFQGMNTYEIGELFGVIRALRALFISARANARKPVSDDVLAAIRDGFQIKMQRAAEEFMGRVKNVVGIE